MHTMNASRSLGRVDSDVAIGGTTASHAAEVALIFSIPILYATAYGALKVPGKYMDILG